MDEKDRERFERITGALGGVGVNDFLIFGTRKTKTCGPDEVESFYCLSAGDKTQLIAALRNIFINNLEITEFLTVVLHEIVHSTVLQLDAITNTSQKGASA